VAGQQAAVEKKSGVASVLSGHKKRPERPTLPPSLRRIEGETRMICIVSRIGEERLSDAKSVTAHNMKI
jgi:hypothetical protein